MQEQPLKNIHQRLKHYANLGYLYRGPYDDTDKITRIAHIVSVLCNLQLSQHSIRNRRSYYIIRSF